MNDLTARPRVRRADAIALSVGLACAAVSLARFSAAATPSSMPTSAPTAGASIDAQIRSELLEHGTLDALAARLRSLDQNDAAVLDDLTRVSLEQGDPAAALTSLQALVRRTPTDVPRLRTLAAVQEQTGRVEDASRTLQAALDAASEPAERTAIASRLVVLLFDLQRDADAIALLDSIATRGADQAISAGLIAYLDGAYDAAARYFALAGDAAPGAVRLLAGNASLRAGRPLDARRAFDAAAPLLASAPDKRYAAERTVAAAREAGTLPALADAWLAQPDLPEERWLALATVLRELHRASDLLAWWRRQAADPARAAYVLSPRFTAEVIGASQDEGLADQAESIARELAAGDPDDAQRLAAATTILLNDRKPDAADALLASRVAASADDPVRLESIGKLARSFGRDAVTLRVADAMRSLGGGNAIGGMLLEASVRLRAGDRDRGVATLREAAEAATRYAAARGEVATALESAGLEPDAIALLQLDVRDASDDVSRERLAALLVNQRRGVEAVPILEALRHDGGSVAVREQAGQRLLEMAIAGGTVDELIARMRAALDEGKGNEADLALLVDAYARTHRSTEAADVLQRTALLDPVARLNRLATLYQRTSDLSAASATLHELVDADPVNAVRTLERLASVELDRHQPRAASQAIDEIAHRIGDRSPSFANLLGGIYDRLNRPAQAAVFYRRALAANPANTDDWLLWSTALAKAGDPRAAIGRLQLLCEEAPNENAFALAADGLLNLKSPPAALRAARRAAICRVAAAPGQTMLLHVIGDLSDELRDDRAIVRAIDVSIALSREERPQLLRELMEIAGAKGLMDEAIACGRSMLALDDDFPPQLFVGLGERLLISGRPDEASRAFARAAESSGDDDVVAPRAAALFEQYGFPSAALATLAPIADRRPADGALREDVARLSELAGRPHEAFEQYLAAIALRDRQIAEASSSQTSSRPGARVPLPDVSRAIDGAIVTARTPPDQDALLRALGARIAIDPTPSDAPPPPPPPMTTRAAPALAALRRAAFAFGRPDVADRVDDEVATRWPAERLLQSAALSARTAAGLYARATRFAAAHGLDAHLPAALRPATPTTAPAGITPGDAAVVLPRLIISGETDVARATLDAVADASPAQPAEVLPTLIAAAVAVGREDAAIRWATRWADAPAAPPSMPTPTTDAVTKASRAYAKAAFELRTVAIAVWRVLPPAGRAALIERVIALSDHAPERGDDAAAPLLALQLAAAEGATFAGQLDAALRVVKLNGSTDGLNVAELVGLLPAADRPAFIRGAMTLAAPEARLAALQQIVARFADPFDAATDAALIEAANALPVGQALLPSDWAANAAHDAVLPAIATATLRNAIDGSRGADAAIIEASLAFVRSSPARADAGALRALRLMTGVAANAEATATTVPATRPAAARAARPGPSRVTLIRRAVAALSPAARDQALAGEDLGIDASVGPWRTVVRSALLEAACRGDEALAALRDAYAAGDDEPEIRQAYVDRLASDGRSAELVATFVVPSADLPPTLREPLTVALQALFRVREVPLMAKRVGVAAETPYRTLDFATPRAAGDLPRLAETLRALLARVRGDGGAPMDVVDVDANGLPARGGSADVLRDAARWPDSIDDLVAASRVAPPGGTVAPRVVELLARALRDPPAAARIVAGLETRAAARAITNGDRDLLLKLGRVPGVSLPTVLVDEVVTRVTNDPADEPDYAGLQQCLDAQHDPRAAGAARWVAARSRVSNPLRSTAMTGRTNTPAPPSPLGTLDDASAATWIESLIDVGNAGVAEQTLAMLRSAGRVTPQHARCAAAWARLAAERGDVDAFAARLAAAIDALAMSQSGGPTRLDVDRCLPAIVTTQETRDGLIDAAQRAIGRSASRRPADATRESAALGRWAHEHGADDAARRLLALSMTLGAARGAGEHQLWTADLARLLGRPDDAWAIERRLLAARCLPAPRIASLLQHLDEIGDTTSALRLAREAAGYCQEPSLRARVAVDSSPSVGSDPPANER